MSHVVDFRPVLGRTDSITGVRDPLVGLRGAHDVLSQFATSSSRIQFLKKVSDGTAKLGLTVSCKSTLLANDKSLGKLIVGHLVTDGLPICQGTAATDLGIETAAGKRRCASHQGKRIWKGRRRAKRVYRLCR